MVPLSVIQLCFVWYKRKATGPTACDSFHEPVAVTQLKLELDFVLRLLQQAKVLTNSVTLERRHTDKYNNNYLNYLR